MSVAVVSPAAAGEIASLYDPELRQRIAGHKAGEAAKVTSADAEIQHVPQ